MRKLHALNAACASIALATPALAQTTSATQANPAANGNAGVEEIVVTAQRRSENLQRVPIAVTAITASRLASSGITNSQDLTIAAPSLTVGSAIGYFQPRIRGIGTTTNGPGVENSVAVYIDGVYIASTPASLFSFNNIERIEILKGPQGTLFGRNATGGLIQVVTKDPSANFGGNARVGYGSYQTVDGAFYVTGGKKDVAAVDLAVQGLHQGNGFGTNFALGKDTNKTDHDFSVRSKLLVTPGDRTQIRLTGDYFDNKGSTPYLRAWSGDTPAFGPQTPGGNWDSNSNIPTRTRLKSGGVTGNIQYETDFARILSITAYRKGTYDVQFDYDLTPTPTLGIFIHQKDNQFSQELQLASLASSRIKWTVGGYYFHASSAYAPIDVTQGFPIVGPTNPFSLIRTASEQRTRSYAAFGQVTVPIDEKTNLTGGIRYTSEKRYLDGAVNGFIGGVNIGNLGPATAANKKFDKVTWRASADHTFGDTMVYASFNRGFKSGGFNPQIPSAAAYAPEVLDAYEIGIKATTSDHRLRFNPSFFYYDYQNLQVPFFTGTGQLGIVTGPRATIYGFDLDFEFAVTRALRLSGGATYMHDRFGRYPSAVFNLRQPVGAFQTTGDATGNRIPFTADFVGSIAATYDLETQRGKFGFNVSYNYNNGFYPEADNLRRQHAFHMANASVSFKPIGTSITARFFVKNMFNEAVLVQLAAAPQVTAAGYQPPRTYGGSLAIDF